MIRAILARDDDWGIGKGNDLPWPRNDEDLAWFKRSTLNSTIIMGRNTWESLPFKPLPQRKNVIVSNTLKYRDDAEIIPLDIYKSRAVTMNMTEDVWIIGGARLLDISLSIIDEFWFSRISGTYDCDTFLPKTAIELGFEMFHEETLNGLCIEKWRKI